MNDPNGMVYWLSPPPAGQVQNCRTVGGFLQLGHTSCGTWSKFLQACADAQGISGHSNVTVLAPTPDYDKLIAAYKTENSITGSVFLGFIDSAGNPVPPPGFVMDKNNALLALQNSPQRNFGFFFVKTVDFGKSEFTPYVPSSAGFPALSKSPGQGNVNARAWFATHAIIKYNKKFYDPSYGGRIHDDFKKWEHASLQSIVSRSSL